MREAQANLEVAEARRAQAAGAVAQAKAQARAAATVPQQIALIEARAPAPRPRCCWPVRRSIRRKLNLERTMVRAPADGVVSRRSVEVGQVVQAGQPLMSITTLDDVWVTANFKETQLGEMRAGPARRGRGGRVRRARVLAVTWSQHRRRDGRDVQPAAADNATGNFVKVVQRVPVKIVLDDARDAGAVLRPGMSVTATVFLR